MYKCSLKSDEQMNYMFQAIEDRTPKQDGEMSLIRGDFISDVHILNNQWAIGRNYRGFVGMFPLQCVMEVEHVIGNLSPVRLPVESLLNDIGLMRHSDDETAHSSSANTPATSQILENMNMDVIANSESVNDNQIVRYIKNSDSIITNVDNQIVFHDNLNHKHKAPHANHNIPDNQTKNTSNLFSKPKMLVKPRPGKVSSKMGSSSSLQNSSQINKEITKLSSTFPSKVSATASEILNSKQSMERNPNSSQVNYTCQCNQPFTSNYRIRGSSQNRQNMANLELYENTRQSISSSNGNMKKIVYTKVNKRTLTRPRSMQTLSNTASFTADSVYSEPNVDSRVLITNSLLKQNTSRAPKRTHRKISFLRIAGCAMTSLFIAVFVSTLMYFALDYVFLYVLIAFCSILMLCFVLLLISKLLRCIVATLLPSMATLEGNIFLIIFIWISLILGPVINIENNLTATIDSVSCILEQSYNKTNALMQPYDAVMRQVNVTILEMEIESQNVLNGLLPLDRGLKRIESGVKNGRIKLLGTQKACEEQMNRAYDACEKGLSRAHNQCQNVLHQIGVVYQQARQALDNLDPNKWGQVPGKLKRQTNSRSDQMNNQLICEPLSQPSVCTNHTTSENICEAASWAGNAIQEAINETQIALDQLMRSLQFHVTNLPYFNARHTSLKESINFNQKILAIYQFHLYYFNLAINLIVKLSPILILILIFASYKYIKEYVTDDKFDNCYIDKDFNGIDHMISNMTNRPPLVPLKDHEKIYIKNQMQYNKQRKSRINVCLFILNLNAVAIVYYISYRHVYAMNLLNNEHNKIRQLDGVDSLEMVVVGEGMFVDLVDLFLKNIHPSQIWKNGITNSSSCIKTAENISLTILAIILTLNVLLLLFIIIQSPLLKWRHRVVSYFYKERHQSRLIWMHDHMTFRRSLYPEIIYEAVRFQHRKMTMYTKISFLHSCFNNNKFCCKKRKCLVCNRNESAQSYRCTSENCVGIFCIPCYQDMRETCPLCHFDIIR